MKTDDEKREQARHQMQAGRSNAAEMVAEQECERARKSTRREDNDCRSRENSAAKERMQACRHSITMQEQAHNIVHRQMARSDASIRAHKQARHNTQRGKKYPIRPIQKTRAEQAFQSQKQVENKSWKLERDGKEGCW